MIKSYDHIVVGGGISGLYFAYQMIKQNPDYLILVLEKSHRLGGRVCSKTIQINSQSVTYDAGAGRLFKEHLLVGKLIEELGLSEKIRTITNSPTIYRTIGKPDQIFDQSELMRDLDKKIQEDILTRSENVVYRELLNTNLYEVIKVYLGKDRADMALKMCVYVDEFIDCNAVDGIKLLNEKDVSDFYTLTGGLGQIIDRMVKKLSKCITIQTNSGVVWVNLGNKMMNEIGTEDGTQYKCKNLVIACPKDSIKKIHFNRISSSGQFKLFNMLDMVRTIPLVRVFAHFPVPIGETAWFDGLGKHTTDPPIKFVIPMDPKLGLIQIAYCGSINARIIGALYKRGELKEYLENYFRKLYPIEVLKKPIPAIERIYFEPYDIGVHHWDYGYLGEKNHKLMIQPWDNQSVYIVGEAYSIKQDWIEGALETSHNLINILTKN
jgi:monoamine oxidase